MKICINRVLSLIIACAMITSNMPVYGAGETRPDTSHDTVSESVVETEVVIEDTEESVTDLSEKDISEEEKPAETAVNEDVSEVEETDIEDDDYHDISDCCKIRDGILSDYTGDYAYITIPNGITTIEYNTFKAHEEIKGVMFPDTLTKIGRSSFDGCSSLELVEFPTVNPLTIDAFAFRGTSMGNGTDVGDLIIPENIVELGEKAFGLCTMLGTVEFKAGDGTIKIGAGVFSSNENLVKIALSERTPDLGGGFASSCKKLKEVIWPTNLSTISGGAFSDCTELLSSDFSMTSLTFVGSYAFYNCTNLPIVKFPISDSLEISDHAFMETSMNNGTEAGDLIIPSNITKLDEYAFYRCPMLGSIVIEDGDTNIEMGYEVFSFEESLTKITLSERVIELPEGFAGNCKLLKEVIWPKTLKKISTSAFISDESLISSDFSNTAITTIGFESFYGCTSLPIIKLPEGQPLVIEKYAFYGSNMKDGKDVGELVIPANVTEIGEWAFASCNMLGTITIKDGDSEIKLGKNTFYKDARLIKITFSSRVRSIPDKFASNCTSLVELNDASNVTQIGDDAFFMDYKGEIVLNNCSEETQGYSWEDDNRVVVGSACSVVFLKDKYNVEVGKTTSLAAVITVYPKGAQIPKLVWTSTNSYYVSVDEKGNVIGNVEGSAAYIDVKTEAGIKKGRTYVKVLKKDEIPDPDPSDPDPIDPIPDSSDPTDPQPSITDDTTELILVKGQKFVLPEKDWKSSDKCLKASKGQIVAKKTGNAKLERPGKTINVQIIAPYFAEKSVKMVAGREKALTLTDAGALAVYYISTNPDVASVDENGNVKAIAKGNTFIQGYVNGVMFKCAVTVSEYDTSAKSFEGTIELAALQTVTVKASGFSAKKASWNSSDQEPKTDLPKGIVYEDAVVRITNKGKLTAIGAGSTTLTAVNGGTELKFTVKVNEPLEKELHVNAGAKKAFKLTGIKKQPVWIVMDTAIASLEKGKITGIKAGETKMTAKCENFDYTVRVFVEDPAIPDASGKPYNYSITIKAGETKQLIPEGAIFQPIAFKSNKNYIAFISSDGMLYGRTKGNATITTKINGKTVKIKVTVTHNQ